MVKKVNKVRKMQNTMQCIRYYQRRHATITTLKQHCRNYFYGCKDTSIQNKYHEDQTYIKDIEHIRMVIKDITEKLKQQHDHNNNNKSNNKLPLDWESYFNDPLSGGGASKKGSNMAAALAARKRELGGGGGGVGGGVRGTLQPRQIPKR